MTDLPTEILIGLGLSAALILFVLYARKWFLQGYRGNSPARHTRAATVTIKGIEGTTLGEINFEVQRGGKFVVFQYCISIIVMSYKRSSSIYFLKAGESALIKGLPFTVLSLIAGPWGIPWGPIWAGQSIATNLDGGKDVTKEVLASLNSEANATTVR
jgi:hypothetical protein